MRRAAATSDAETSLVAPLTAASEDGSDGSMTRLGTSDSRNSSWVSHPGHKYGTRHIDATQNVYGRSWWEERVEAVTRTIDAVFPAQLEFPD